MKTRTAATLVSLILLIIQASCSASPLSETLEISGVILNPNRVGVPGAIVSVVSAETRQKPVFSDNQGRFTFRIAVSQLADWYVEIYWNKDLMFRNELRQLKIQGEASNFTAIWNQAFNNGGHVDLEPIVLGK